MLAPKMIKIAGSDLEFLEWTISKNGHHDKIDNFEKLKIWILKKIEKSLKNLREQSLKSLKSLKI